MGFTQAELDEFHQYAGTQISNGSVTASLEECLHRWRSLHQSHQDSVAGIRESIADEEAGRLRPLSVIDAEIRRERGYST